jgi:hypothetical protein
MRRLLIALSAAAAIAASAAIGFAAQLAPLTATSACSDASQILNCINSAVYGLLNGTVAPATTTLLPFGASANGATGGGANVNATINAQRGILSHTNTGSLAAVNGNLTFVVTDSFVTAASMCLATVVASNAASASDYQVSNVVPAAGSMNITIQNHGSAATGNNNVSIAFLCM